MLFDRISGTIEFLKENPWIGATSGFGSWTLLTANFFTSPAILAYVGIFAAWCGALICALTLFLKVVEAFEKISQRLKRKP